MIRQDLLARLRWVSVPISACLALLAASVLSWPIGMLVKNFLGSPPLYPAAEEFIVAGFLPYDCAATATLVILVTSIVAPAHQVRIAGVLLILIGIVGWIGIAKFYSQIYYPEGAGRFSWAIIGTYIGGLIGFMIVYLHNKSKGKKNA